MTKTPTPKLPPPPYLPTPLPGGPQRIIDICEEMRKRNQDGYLPGVGGLLAKIKYPPGLPTPPECHGTTCSPFTATVIGVAFDPGYPRKDLDGDPYEPKFNGGNDPMLPFWKFYGDHNSNDSAVTSIEKYNLGWELKDADYRKVRRGDLVEISWWPDKGGHVVFCWDVHFDKDGLVDCIQFLGSNGGSPGVSIHGCSDKRFLSGHNAQIKTEMIEVEVPDPKDPEKDPAKKRKIKKKKAKITLVKKGDYEPVLNPKMFDDIELIARVGQWYALPGIPKDSIDPKSFRYPPDRPILYAETVKYSFYKVRFARFHYKEDPLKPFNVKDGAIGVNAAPRALPASQSPAPSASPAPAPAKPATPPPPPKPGHVDAPVTVVKPHEIKKDPEAPKKVPPKPAKQDPEKSVNWQRFVEYALQTFYRAKWIDADPGEPDDIADAKSKAALKKYQEKFHLEVDGIIGPESLGSIGKQLPACIMQSVSQTFLVQLHRAKRLEHDPGAVDGTNHDETRAAVEEFQSQNGLRKTGVPDSDTAAKLLDAVKALEATAEKPGGSPELHHLYWVGNTVAPGGSATLCLHSQDLVIGQECAITLTDRNSGKSVAAKTPLKVDKPESKVALWMPAEFGPGASVVAEITAQVPGAGPLDAMTPAPMQIAVPPGAPTETADWRPYIGKPEVPAEILDAIRRNRARYKPRKLVLVTGKYAGEHHYDYSPRDDSEHTKWARAWTQKKIDAAGPAEKQIPTAFLVMLDAEGRPASLQTYDNQIVTWGVGLGAKGDGVHAFAELNKTPAMKKLLDDLGINYEKYNYHVVDLEQKKVVSSSAGSRGNDNRHIPPLQAWRRQTDLLSAIIGISEDPATREAVAESQYAVYISNSTKWPGKDKVHTGALFFMIVHLHHWMPAIAKQGFNVETIFQSSGGGTPSNETDKKIALAVARGFVREAKAYFITRQADKNKYKDTYDDIHTRTKTHVWAKLRGDGKKEGFDPGVLTYED